MQFMFTSLFTRTTRQARTAPAPRRRSEPLPRMRWYR
jgi:hypothetical protein